MANRTRAEIDERAAVLSIICGPCPKCSSFEATYAYAELPGRGPIEWFRCDRCSTRYQPVQQSPGNVIDDPEIDDALVSIHPRLSV